MTYGLRYFDKVQVSNVEGTPGVAEAATEIFTGEILAKPWDYMQKQDHHYNAGALINRSTAPTVVRHLAEFNYSNDMDDREIIWLIESALCLGSVSTNTWSFLPTWEDTGNAPGDTAGISTFTWEMGGVQAQGEVAYCFVQRLEIAGSSAEELITVSADIVGRQFITEGSFTDLSGTGIVARVHFPFSLAKFYIDNFDTNWATTFTTPAQIYNIESFSFVWESGMLPHFPGAGNYYFYDVTENPELKKATITLAQNQTSATPAFSTELAAALAGTSRYLTLDLYGTGGTREVKIQVAATYMDFKEGDVGGIRTFDTVLENVGYGVGGAAVDTLDIVVNSSLTAFP